MKDIGKKGTHVGIMISFSLFILFLMSTFFLIRPVLEEKEEKSSVLDSLEQDIIENVSSNMTLTLLKINDSYNSGGKTCLSFSDGGWTSYDDISVINSSGERVACTFSSPTINVDWTSQNRFLKIYSSSEGFEEIILGNNDCASPLEGTDFSIKSIKKEKYVFESSIARLATNYQSSYENVKVYLGIPQEEEFGFSFINSSGMTSINVGKEPSSIGIYSKEIPVVYVDDQSNIASGVIRLKVWG